MNYRDGGFLAPDLPPFANPVSKNHRPIMAPHIMYSGSAQSMSKLGLALFVTGGGLLSIHLSHPKKTAI